MQHLTQIQIVSCFIRISKKFANENSWKIGRDIARLEAALSV